MPEQKVERGARWIQFASIAILTLIIIGTMLGAWVRDPPDWFMGILALLAIGVDRSTLRQLALTWVTKQAEKERNNQNDKE